MSYLLFKLVHLVAVVLFMGNIVTGLFWKAIADRTRDWRIIAHTMRGIIAADRWFTLPGVVIIVAAGFGAAIVGRLPLLGTGWILWSIILFTLSGLAFAFAVAPLQKRLLKMAVAAESGEAVSWDHYRAMSLRWELWGLFATVTPLAAVVLMVLKPAL